ncbi:MAG: zinc-dependent metalloprotease [Aeromicrobium sp.]|nr:MAG: zinc-dependent metalloprotease [Aeromicrobium sp.]
MVDDANQNPDDPFRGTPFEGMFQMFGASQPDMGNMMSMVRQFMQPYRGPVNYDLARKTARETVHSIGPDPAPSIGQRNAVQDAMRLADMWLDRATALPSPARHAVTWTRDEWVEQTLPEWKSMISPLAVNAIQTMEDSVPDEARAMIGPLAGMLKQAGGALFGQQLGTGLGHLSSDVLSSTDIGLPLGPHRAIAIVPHNVAELAKSLELPETDVFLYVVLRENAHLRLFHHATWLRVALLNAIEEFGKGMGINVESIEERVRSIDPSDPAAIQEALNAGMFEPEATPAMQKSRERLELLLALIEGWVDEVVGQATADTMPTTHALAEAMRRRRVTKGPAEEAFASLVGLELRPRRLRDAAALWGALRDREGPAARDAIWGHPDLAPTMADLDDPLGFGRETESGLSDAEFDAALEQLLDEGTGPDGGSDNQPDAE